MSMSNHPTGLVALAASALVIIAGKVGLDLSPEEAVIFVGLAAAIVSKFTPRIIPNG